MRRFRRIPIAVFAEDLGVSRDTAKRLFQRNVLPDEWVECSGVGKKWFILINDERLPIARDAVRFWKGVRRRPQGSTAFRLADLIGKLALDLFQLRILGRLAIDTDLTELQCGVERGETNLFKIEEKLRELCRTPQGAATLLVASRLLEFRESYGRSYTPESKELAEWMGCSVPTLYREPYGGPEVLKKAEELLREAVSGGSKHDVEMLVQSGGELTQERIRWELSVTPERAQLLLEAWQISSSYHAPTEDEMIDPWVTNQQKQAEAQFWDPDQPSQEQLLESTTNVKKRRDRKRSRLMKRRLLIWEFGQFDRGAIFLSIVPERAYGIVKRYRETMNPKITDASAASAKSQIDMGRERLGCILLEGNQYLKRTFDNGVTPESHHDSIEDAASSLLDRVRSEPGAKKLDPAPDWDALMTQALDLWKNRGSSFPSATTKR